MAREAPRQRAADHVGRILEQWRRERPELDVSPIGIIGRLHRLAATLHQELEVVYREFGLGSGEADILFTLRRSGRPYALTPTELAEATMVTSGAVSKRVDRLVAAALVSRSVSPVDARSWLVSLTPAGVELADRAFERHLANERRLVSHLSPGERRDLAALLEKWGAEVGS